MKYDNKWRNGLATILGVVLIILIVPLPVQANILVNGSFETGINLPPLNYFGGVSETSVRQIDGWYVTSGAIEWIGRQYWEASDGNYSIDLSAGSPGTISTNFKTIVGMNYKLSFDLAGNPRRVPSVKVMDVTVAGINKRFTFDVTDHSVSDMGWQTETLEFTANAMTTNLSFIGVSPSAYGAAIDNVDVSVVSMPGDLVFTPVTPCRIVDTRKTSAGIIDASTQRNFRVFGSGGTISAQGGNTAGCSSPLGEPLAAHINMVAVDPTGKRQPTSVPSRCRDRSGIVG